MSILPKAIYRFNAIYQATNGIFQRTRTNDFTICMETQKKLKLAKAIFRKKNGTGEINPHDFRLYYKAAVIKTVWQWHKERNTDQWNKIESPEMNLCIYGHVMFDKGAKLYNGKMTISITSGAGKTGQPPVKE